MKPLLSRGVITLMSIIAMLMTPTIAFKRRPNGRVWLRALSSLTNGDELGPVTESTGSGIGTAERKRKKRKVAIVCGFVGSKYHGLQMDANSPFETVEFHISQSLNKVGCVIESNQNELSKIGWSRSSRTDKGVHAARMVLSGKLEIDEEHWLEEEDGRMPKLAALIDKELPDDIACLSALKMNQGFRAREAGHYREYEYLFPLSMLLKEHSVEGSKFQKGTVSSLPRTSSEAIERFNEELVKMEGSLSFHNFHKLSPKALRETQRGDEKKKASSSKTEPVAIGTPSSSSTQDRNYFFDPWIKRDRSVQEKTRTVIYTCRAAAKPISLGGTAMVKVSLKGQSFLLHQIRLMMGAAILIARGTMPAMTLELALSAPYHVLFPMAPAEGLVLTNAGFNRNCNGQSLALDPSIREEVDRVMMTSSEWDRSEAFKLDRIYRQVAHDWSVDSGALVDAFLTHCDRYHVPESLVEGEWSRLLDEAITASEQDRQNKNQREASRVFKNVADFREYCLLEDERFEWSDEMDEWLRNNEGGGNRRDPGIPFRIKLVPHKALLPNTLATALVCHFKCTPGSVILTDALRAVATFVVSNPNDGCENLDAEQLFAFVVEKAGEGGLTWWQRQIKHELIV